MSVMYEKTGLAMEYEIAHKFYENELDRVISKLHENSQAGIIRWEKWNRERFEKNLVKYMKREFNVNINAQLVYEEVVAEYPRVYIQQDFMEETYGYTYSCHSGYYKDYGNAIFHATPTHNGKYDFEEFFDYWIFTILRPKYNKWLKKGWLGRKELSQRWYPLRDVVMHYDNTLSKEDVKNILVSCLKARHIVFKEITDFEIIW